VTGDAVVSIPLGVRLVDPAGTEYPCVITYGGVSEDGLPMWVVTPQGIGQEPLPGEWVLKARYLPDPAVLGLALP
jgi:hypothetical protein